MGMRLWGSWHGRAHLKGTHLLGASLAPHIFLSVLALIPHPTLYSFPLGRCSVSSCFSWKYICHLGFSERFDQNRNLCRSWKMETKEQPLFSKGTEGQSGMCPAHAHCCLHCRTAAPTTGQQCPTAHPGMRGLQPSEATVVLNSISQAASLHRPALLGSSYILRLPVISKWSTMESGWHFSNPPGPPFRLFASFSHHCPPWNS